MRKRGPKSSVLKRLAPAERVELDEAILEGRLTRHQLHEKYGRPYGLTYAAVRAYSIQLEASTKHRYIGTLLKNVFGNVQESDLNTRAKGVMAGMLDKVADELYGDGKVQPQHLRDVVQSYDVMRRGVMAQARDEREQAEWEANRMAGVAEAAAWIKKELAAEISGDPELQKRLDGVVDRCCQHRDLAGPDGAPAKLLQQIGRKRKWEEGVWQAVKLLYGIEWPRQEPRPSEQALREQIREVYNVEPKGEAAPKV